MKKAKKVVALALCAVMLVVGSVAGTMAFLADTDDVVNTFTVGKVDIKLDEAKVVDGKADANAARVQTNTYKLLPGLTYDKDPMVTVLNGSESSYIKMTLTLSKSNELDEIFPNGVDLTTIFGNYEANTWLYKGNVENSDNTRTYEFWYKEAVAASNGDVALTPLFKTVTLPGTITNAQLEKINGMTITVNAYAIQAAGFTDAADAWSNAPESWTEYSAPAVTPAE